MAMSRDPHPGKLSSANAIIKISHSGVEDRTMKTARRSLMNLVFVSALVTVINGLDLRGKSEPSAEDCTKPPMTKFGHECCRLPKERIWGDLRPSLNSCFKKLKGTKSMRQEMGEEAPVGTPDMMTPTEGPVESGSTPYTPADHPGKPRGKKPHHFRRLSNDSCFMECVFEDQGFLLDKMVNKAALIERLSTTLGRNEPWRNTAVAAVETCYQMELAAPINKTCQSGSEEMFRCIFKQIFFNCPSWTQSDYCMSLKSFYEKCPNGPPPEMEDNHPTSPIPPPVEEEIEISPSTESER